MDKTVQGFSNRLLKFLKKNSSYRLRDWDEFSDGIWRDMFLPEIVSKAVEPDFSSFCDIMVMLDRNHEVIRKHGADHMAIGSQVNISKLFFQNMIERGWSPAVEVK